MSSQTVTRLQGSRAEVRIGANQPTVIIGNRINPAGRSRLADSLQRLDMSPVAADAAAQVREGADVIAVNVSAEGVDEEKALVLAVQAVAEAVPVPLLIDATDPHALAAALKVCPGKPLVRLLSWSQDQEILRLILKRGAAVVAVASGTEDTPRDMMERFELTRQVFRTFVSGGVPREDVIVEPVIPSLATDKTAVKTAMQVIARLERVDAVNMTLNTGTVSAGLPAQGAIDDSMLGLAIMAGVTCPMLDPAKTKRAVLIADLLAAKSGAVERYTSFAG